MLNIIKNTINRVFASGVDSDVSAFITATGLSGTTQKSAITTLVKDLKSSGLWSKMKAVYPMITDNYNLLSYTEDFNNIGTKNQVNVNNNTTSSPNGTNTADTIIETASTTEHYINTIFTKAASSLTYTASVYFKNASGTRNFGIGVTNGVSAGKGAIFSTSGTVVLSSFNIGTGAGFSVTSTSIQDAGNGWYRAILTVTTDAATRVDFVTYIVNGTSTLYTGDGTSAIYAWGAQFEQSSTASAYQPILTTPAAFMASQMKYNLKDARDLDAAFRLTWSGGWTYSATGATPNGTNGYIDTNLVGNTNISQGNFGFGIYSRTNSSTVGAYGINGALHIYPKFTDGNTYYRIFGGGSAVSGQTTLGLIYGFNDSTSTSYGWFNGVKKQTTPSSNYTIPSTNLMFAGNVTGTGGYDSRQLSFGFASLYLNDSEAQLLNQIVEKYQVALSRGVQAAQSFYYNSAYSNESNTYLYSTQITGTTQVSAINTLINGLKANNLWTKMKAVYPFVTDYRNILSFTEDFTAGAYWGRTNNIVTKNTITAPNGTLTGNTLTGSSTTSNLFTATPFPLIGNNILSLYVKAGSVTSFNLIFATAGTGYGGSSIIDLSTGTPGAITYYGGASGWSVNVQSVGDGWYRCSIGGNIPTTQNMYGQITFGIGTLYAWGIQLEIGTSASAYQAVLGVNNYATNVAAQMKFNLVNPQDSDAAFRLAFSGGWTYSTNGAQPNGTNGYADTKLIENNVLSLNNAHISIYSRTNASGLYADIGNNITAETNIFPNLSNTFYPRVQHGNLGLAINYNTAAMFIANRVLSTEVQGWRNNVKNTLASISTGKGTGSLFIGAMNTPTGALYFSPKQLAFSTIGDGLSDAEAALLYTLIQQFQTDLSRQV